MTEKETKMLRDSAALVRAMQCPDFYPHAPGEVKLVQTHISWVFLAGDRVYKLKKPIALPFLDFSTQELRRTFCDLELRLNRRLAPETYLAVASIYEDGGAFSLSGSGEPADYAVVMRRLPEEGMFPALLSAGKLAKSHLEQTARRLCAFHAAADTGGTVDLIGEIGFIGRNHVENFSSTESYAGKVLSAAQHAFLRGFGDRFLREHHSLFASRVKDHRIRDCHGDLHLGNICQDGDRLVIFDCIEFSRRFRYEDVAAEVAFLAMDLEFNGAHDLSEAFTSTYLRLSADWEIEKLLRFYKFYRACVRAKVHCIRSSDPGVPAKEREQAAALAGRYFDLAAHYAARTDRPGLFVCMGLSGSGKSALARELAGQTGAVLLQSDVLRKEIHGIPARERHPDAFGQGLYDEGATARTYAELFTRAREHLETGRSVILDATFISNEYREKAFALSRETNAEFCGLWCSVPEEETRRRLRKRQEQKDEASDGRFEIYLEQKKHWEPPRSLYAHRIFHIETLESPRDLAFIALSRFLGGKGPAMDGPAAEC